MTTGRRLLLSLACISTLGGLWALPVGAAEGDPGSCKMLLAEGRLETRRAHFPEAVEIYERALTFPQCASEAQLGLAETYNGMNRHKEALAMAESALRSAGGSELAALAHHQIGLALDVRGRRLNSRKKRAMAAFEQAVELSGGQLEPAIRALMRIYRETGQDDELAALEERFPKVRSSSRAEQVQQMQEARKKRLAKSPPASAAEAAGPTADATEGPTTATQTWTLDCLSRERTEGLATDASVLAPTAEDWQNGLVRPKKVEAYQPQYTERARKERIGGVVIGEVLIDEQGVTRSARLVRGLHPDLDASALDSLCSHRWLPAKTSDGKALAIYYQLTVNFNIR